MSAVLISILPVYPDLKQTKGRLFKRATAQREGLLKVVQSNVVSENNGKTKCEENVERAKDTPVQHC